MYLKKHITNLRVMLEARCYDTEEHEEFFDGWSDDETRESCKPMIFCHSENGDLMMIFFLSPVKLNQQILQIEICQPLIEENIKHAMVIMHMPWTTPARQAAEKFIKQNYHIEFFHLKFFNFDRHTHHTVPQFTLLTKDKGRQFMTKLKVKPADMPAIYNNDIQVMYMGWDRLIGRVVMIKRAQNLLTSSHGPEISFRVIRPAKINKLCHFF